MPDEEPEASGGDWAVLSLRFHHYDLGAGSSGSGESGSGCAEHDADLVRSMRSRRISCCGIAANAVLRGTSAAAACLLRRGVCTGDVRAEGFFKRGL